MDIATRRICLIRMLPNPHEDFVKPICLGGCDRSHHSNDLIAMCKLGLVEKRRYYIKEGSKGHWRYRLTEEGRSIRDQIKGSKSIIPFRKHFLLRKNGITARVLDT